MIKAMIDRSAAGRIGTPDDIAAAVEFLLSPAASFITGTDLVVDGGITGAVQAGCPYFEAECMTRGRVQSVLDFGDTAGMVSDRTELGSDGGARRVPSNAAWNSSRVSGRSARTNSLVSTDAR